jgi:hypothetical protein
MWWDRTWCGVCLFKLCNQLVLRVCVEVNTSAVLVCSTEEFLCELVILSEFVFLYLFSSSVCACFHPPRETSKVLLLAFV